MVCGTPHPRLQANAKVDCVPVFGFRFVETVVPPRLPIWNQSALPACGSTAITIGWYILPRISQPEGTVGQRRSYSFHSPVPGQQNTENNGIQDFSPSFCALQRPSVCEPPRCTLQNKKFRTQLKGCRGWYSIPV